MHKKTKIVASIGPATRNKKVMEEMAKAGLNVARLNFSHDTHESHLESLELARAAAKKTGYPIAILQDLSGPKIRIGDFGTESVTLNEGASFIITTDSCVGDEKRVSVTYKNLHKEIKPGAFILLNDGKNKLLVEKVSDNDIHTKVIVGGVIKGRRGVNLPGSYLKLSSLTAKDKEDLKFGIKHKVDYMALSFVRTASDVLELRQILQKAKADIHIISKIETQEAIENLDEIIDVSDAIMVARGDLAVETAVEKVPVLQKMIIEKCNNAGKPVITATQMLESMIKNPVPTRAEVNDVANAILDGTDAVMLSEESTLGLFPVKAIEFMSNIAKETENYFPYEAVLDNRNLEPREVADAITYAVVNTAYNIDAKAIVALTESGFTARMISRFRPKQPVLTLTPNVSTYNRSALVFGCYAQFINNLDSVSEAIKIAKKSTLQSKVAKSGDKIVIAAGIPFGKSGSTNVLLAQTL